jgi:hypothetical protein
MKKIVKVIFVSAMIFAIAKSGGITSEYLLNSGGVTLLADGLPYEH